MKGKKGRSEVCVLRAALDPSCNLALCNCSNYCNRNVAFFLVVVVLGFELRNLCLLGSNIPLEPRPSPPALLTLVIFGTGSCIYVQAGLDHNPPIYVSWVAGMTGAYHQPSYWLRWGLTNFLPSVVTNCNPPDIYLWLARILGMSHCAWHYAVSYLVT
jgi:hypothetical protein